MSSHWLTQSAIAMIVFVPIWLAIGFSKRNFGISPDVFAAWYFLGNACTAMCMAPRSLEELVPSYRIVLAMIGIGIVGGFANTLVYRAVAGAPNPGLPVAMVSCASVGVFLLSAVCVQYAPTYFDPVEINVRKLIGIACAVIGVTLIAMK